MSEQFSGLLRLRASPPRVSSGFVARPRLTGQLNAAVDHPVTLVSAGPGYGKTLTLASWSHGQGAGRVAWLSVDQTDNDLRAFWNDVLGALVIAGVLSGSPALVRPVLPRANPSKDSGDRELSVVRSALAELTETVILVVDDFHLIDDTQVQESVGQLLEHQPPQLRLVLSTRSDPALRLNRLRVNGDLTDIRADDLAFTRDEALELLRRNGIRPTGQQLDVLLDRTQGWAVGLRLALMRLDPADLERGIADFTGRNRLVAEYLIEEVTDRLTAVDREFLLTTSMADRINGSLANELTGGSDGQLVLERLMTQNTLLVGLAGSNEWFSVHPMLRSVLAHRLAVERPGAVQELHLRASRWFAAHDEPIQAIRHAVAAEQWDEVSRLLTEIAWPQMLTPNAAALASALEPAAERARTNPTTGMLLAAAVRDLRRQDFESMIRAVDSAAHRLADVSDDDRYAAEALIAVLRVTHSRIHNPSLTASTSLGLLQLLDRVPQRNLPTSGQHRLVATNNLAVGQLWTGDLETAEATLNTVQIRCRENGLGLTELSAQAHLSLLDVVHGRLTEARRRVSEGQDLAGRCGWTSQPQALGLFTAGAMAQLDRGQLDLATATVESGLALSRTSSDAACRVALGIVAVGIAVTAHRQPEARAASTQLQNISAQAGELPPMLARWCTVTHADVHLATEDPETALALIGEISEPPGYVWALEHIAMARAQLMLGQPSAALDLLDRIHATALPYRVAMVDAWVLTAVVADRMHRFTAALTALTKAIDLAQDEDIYRPFLLAGSQIHDLLARHRHLVSRHLEFTGILTSAINGDAPAVGAGTTTGGSLTERELAVLSYLPTMLNSAEIASDLFVTAHTVKSHQQSIYRKLGVNTRRTAVDRARELNLI